MGSIHAANIAAHQGAKLASVVDPHAEGAKRLAELFDVQVASPEDVFSDRATDAIVIASAASTHAELIEGALASGKAIFCEKPIARDLASVRKTVEKVESEGVPFLLGFNRRFDPGFVDLRSRLHDSSFGAPELVILTSRDPKPPPLDYVRVSGGIVRETTIHDIDMARWLTGEDPASVYAVATSRWLPRVFWIPSW